jgi:hypothetical protein
VDLPVDNESGSLTKFVVEPVTWMPEMGKVESGGPVSYHPGRRRFCVDVRLAFRVAPTLP